MKKLKKLILNKDVIAQLNNENMSNLIGGNRFDSDNACKTAAWLGTCDVCDVTFVPPCVGPTPGPTTGPTPDLHTLIQCPTPTPGPSAGADFTCYLGGGGCNPETSAPCM